MVCIQINIQSSQFQLQHLHPLEVKLATNPAQGEQLPKTKLKYVELLQS